ncbi:hypothetical protein Tco_1203385 [Tanacetum coccineum]
MESEHYSLNYLDSPTSQHGLEVSSIRRIQGIGYGVLEFLGEGTTLDIFQNIHILYLEYGVLDFSGYGVLSLFPLWSLVLEMFVDKSLEMIVDESLEMIEDESLDMIMNEPLMVENKSLEKLVDKTLKHDEEHFKSVIADCKLSHSC